MKTTPLFKKVNNINFKKLTKIFIDVAVIILLVTAWFWYKEVYMTPERRFWMAIENSMSVPSVVRTLTQGGSGNQVTQNFRFHFSPQQVQENTVVFNEKNATSETNVETEGVVFPGEQYLRYTSFSSQSNDGTSRSLDDVLGQWATQISTIPEDQARQEYIGELVTLVIFGNFNSNFRNEVIKTMQNENVYGDAIVSPTETEIEGEDHLEYSINVDLKKFAVLLNDSFVKAGYGDFPPLNPDNYEEGTIVNGAVSVRVRDNAVTKVSFGGREEVYSNYGVLKNVERPEASLTVQELQTNVQTLLAQ